MKEKERKKTDQACFLPLQLLMMLFDVSGIHMTKLVTKTDMVEKLHGIIKYLLLQPLQWTTLVSF